MTQANCEYTWGGHHPIKDKNQRTGMYKLA